MRSLRLSQQQVQAIVDHCVQSLPDESCGLIAGHHERQVVRIIPISNVADNPNQHYLMDASEQIQALKKLDVDGLKWLGVYHSHPKGKPIPSLEDNRDAALNTPNLIHLIVGLKHNKSRLQAWHIHDEQVDEVELLIGQQRSNVIKPMSRLQIWAILFTILIAVILLLTISFSLLPPAPVLPTP